MLVFRGPNQSAKPLSGMLTHSIAIIHKFDECHVSNVLFLPLIWRYYSEHKWNAKVSVSRIRDLLLDPVTGKWKWPINDADEVYPGILLGDG